MLSLVSPAKKLDFEFDNPSTPHTQPDFLEQAEKLVRSAKKLSRTQLAQTMNLSDSLADLNYRRFRDFTTPFDLSNAKQAALVFNGDTYVGLDAASLTEHDFSFAQDHLRILSGLYGLLRPLDLIQPYRLEMGARFRPERKTSLYDFWDGQITDAINHCLAEHTDRTVINCASNEYFKAVKTNTLTGTVITPVFKEVKDGEARTLGMFAKRARGMMARFIVQNRIDRPEGIKDFSSDGYGFRPDISNQAQWVFTRNQPPPVRK